MTELNVTLPQEQQLEVKFNPIPRPQDDRLFHTRAGKGRTLESGVAGVVTDIDAATRPLQQASMALVASEQTLNQSLEELNQNEQRVEELIKSLQDGMGEVEKELTQISVPFSWMPMNVQTFVMAFPAFCSLAFFILAIRFARLSKLRLRLIREMSQADMKDKDIELALCVPNIMLDFLSPVTLESPWRSRVVGALVPLLILVFLGFILLRIQLSPVFKLHSPFLVPLEALGILTAILAWKSFRRYQRFRSSDSKSE